MHTIAQTRPAEGKGVCDSLSRPAIADWVEGMIGELSRQLPAEEMAVLKSQANALNEATPTCKMLAPDPTKPTIVRDQDGLADLAAKVAVAAELTVDLETQGLDPHRGQIVGVGLAVGESTFYIPTSHRFETDGALRPGQLPLIDVMAALRLQEKSLIGHNAKYETKWLSYHGGVKCHFTWDTMIAARLLRSDLPADLKDLAVRELDVPDWGLSKAELKRIQLLPIEMVAAYCAKDCWYTTMLYRRQQACLV